MSKQLYEEALADVKKVKEIAEDNARRSILEAVTPRIRDLIEQELLREHDGFDDNDFDNEMSSAGLPGATFSDAIVASPFPAVTPGAITLPDADGKVTLDLDALNAVDQPEVQVISLDHPIVPQSFGSPAYAGDEEYELNLESIDALVPVMNATKAGITKEIELRIYRLGEITEKFSKAARLIRESVGYQEKIAQMISRVENMYDYVQESIKDPAKKSSYETKLEALNQVLNTLQESTTMAKNRKSQMKMNEGDVTLKLTGLPDDLDLETIGVDLITGEEEEGVELGDEGDLGLEDETGDEEEVPDFGAEEEEPLPEGRQLSDDTIVEIDEKMLRREITRMKALRESGVPSSQGHGVGTKEFDDFGGAKDEGEAFLDGDKMFDADDVSDMCETDEVDELAEADELDELDQVGDERTRDEFGGSATSVPSLDKNESLKRRVSFEKRLQERAKSQAAALKTEASSPRTKNNPKRLALVKREYAVIAKRFNESVVRTNKISKFLAESAQKLRNESRSNSGSNRSADKTVEMLRAKLAETNLINAKLVYTNKLLQNEVLSTRQKAQVIEQLDSAKTLSEAKSVYENLAKAIAKNSKTVNENASRKVIGSASRTTRPASTPTLNEGVEADRWARLAGIVK